ncbi:TetR/AcrR family transcriptional regulator [Streptomyces abikoensis]|uniref:TetR/AcrR family transcriptional regulator n=1 Tax=Streptomyces abikoensis TaxID=97398 RepID=UPI0033C09B1E
METAVREDPRATRTRAKLRQALLEACADHPLAQVSVAALVRRAEAGRATFYLHYAGLEALAVDACADIVREAVDALHAWRGTPDPATPPPALLDFFDDLAPHAGLYRGSRSCRAIHRCTCRRSRKRLTAGRQRSAASPAWTAPSGAPAWEPPVIRDRALGSERFRPGLAYSFPRAAGRRRVVVVRGTRR